MRKSVKLAILLISVPIILLAGAASWIAFSPGSTDYGVFLKMREYQIGTLNMYGAEEKGINRYFENYKLDLPFLYKVMFKADNLSLFLRSYRTEKIDTASINQLEIGNGTDDFFDFTFMIRPDYRYNAPLFHGDALKALPGVTSALYMDFYSLNDGVDTEQFFSESQDKILRAIELAQPYWKREGFGELTPHLDPYKSPYRLEMIEPEKGTEEERKEYFDTVYSCFVLYSEAYLESLERMSGEENLSEAPMREREVKDFVSILYEKDMAVKMGKMIFPEEDFDRYFLDGFWGTGPLE
ncbi:hypothetical protein [Spirochaeta isovalerica]|uniref:Uncharacterized protein n=1 Tax=Spirochaeta isovalerica TaxID=150 RepID=A0A841R848_9SPIO|nr:hypothetical protein [Spirochaeta isovalerica]MBB6479367.1 hypothetical protein [Spirochaeta isovalerica]